ncbi:MAG: DNA polymerase [Micrococcales bacterium]|nr:DNA polymerase [Micrococcales bacterium]
MTEQASRAPLVALVVGPNSTYAAGPGLAETWPRAELASRVAAVSARSHPRWVIWSADSSLREVVSAGVDPARTWDLAEAHLIIHGGSGASPGRVVAGCRGLAEGDVPPPRPHRLAGFDDDLFDVAAGGPGEETALTGTGHLRADALTGWATTPERLREIAALALECQAHQEESLRAIGGDRAERMIRTVWSESAAAVLCLELERDGLPVDRLAAEDLIGAAAGPRPTDEADAARIRAQRDHVVVRHAPGRGRVDLRNPAQVKDLLASAGVRTPTTRAWVLEPYRDTHPLVDALLTWRKDERIATTYGYRWLDEHVGADDRLRGTWTVCDGAAGRMTAQHGLHNLPTPLRPAIRAAPGHVFVRADLGQVEPRVLAVVSSDPALAEATRSDDLYAPVAATLGVARPLAKVAVLAAMYGQRSGAAGEALTGLERAYPVAMRLLDATYARGVAREPIRTFGGRLIRLDPAAPDAAASSEPSGIPDRSEGARGRYARNAIIQGSAAELFKAWAATVRHEVAPLRGQIVLCLHDELLVHVPEERAREASRAVEQSLTAAARRWAETDRVRFVVDIAIVRRWSDAKD